MGSYPLLFALFLLIVPVPPAQAISGLAGCCNEREGVSVILNGESIGACPAMDSLKPGRYRLEIRRDPKDKRYYDYSTEIALSRGKFRKAHEKEEEAFADSCHYHRAAAIGDVAAWDDYLRRFPNGRYVLEVGQTVARLEQEAQERKMRAEQAQQEIANALLEKISANMLRVKGGCFQMGDGMAGGHEREKPVHEVCVKDFGLSKFPVTQGQWKAVMGENPSRFGGCGDDCPAEQISWNDAQLFIRRLNGLGSGTYRLPSEAEWEYAAREGTSALRYWGNEIGQNTADCSNCGRKWDKQPTAPVGRFKPNAFGLYDMLGNVYQWTEDCWHGSYHGAPADGSARAGGDCRKYAVRGGSWHYYPHYVRTAFRYGLGADYRSSLIGFRLATTLP